MNGVTNLAFYLWEANKDFFSLLKIQSFLLKLGWDIL